MSAASPLAILIELVKVDGEGARERNLDLVCLLLREMQSQTYNIAQLCNEIDALRVEITSQKKVNAELIAALAEHGRPVHRAYAFPRTSHSPPTLRPALKRPIDDGHVSQARRVKTVHFPDT